MSLAPASGARDQAWEPGQRGSFDAMRFIALDKRFRPVTGLAAVPQMLRARFAGPTGK
ncbi:hypothetical protein [Micromonospora arborensis]|uniref:hypothetical protein n=1 Tax=Micromonospora arborensis TaxID=2116518 RepID=UPI00142E72BD|nr:hypothetical protein [Micromonospora arborensis]